jgi:hypothetical protein
MGDSVARKLNVLLLCDQPEQVGATVHDHIDALVQHSGHAIWLLRILGNLPPDLDLDRFDAILLHYTLVLSSEMYLSRDARYRIARARAVKAVFIQDEYRFIDRSIAAFRELGVDVLFTCVPTPEIEKVYPQSTLPGVRKVNVLTGYVNPALVKRKSPRYLDRPIDVGYRGRKVPAWLGDLGQEKYRIGLRFLADAERYGLRCDIAYREEDRLYGDAWTEFLSHCKAVLGVESGSSVFDFTGDIQQATEAAVRSNPSVSYESLRDRYFAQHQHHIKLNQISPRCFEAAALRTLMVLYEGEYSGILKADRHYVALRKDHGNMDEVVAVLRDPARAEKIIEAAYQEVALNPAYSFHTHVQTVDDVIASEHARKGRPLVPRYTVPEFAAATLPSLRYRRRVWQRRLLGLTYVIVFKRMLGFVRPQTRDVIQTYLSRVAKPVLRFLRLSNV